MGRMKYFRSHWICLMREEVPWKVQIRWTVMVDALQLKNNSLDRKGENCLKLNS